jgi:hypothetical protein
MRFNSGFSESRYVRLQRFRALMKTHLGTAGRFDGTSLQVELTTGGLSGLLGAKQTLALQVESPSTTLFESDWDDLSLQLFHPGSFQGAKALAEAYEQLTDKEVTLICHFHIDPTDIVLDAN